MPHLVILYTANLDPQADMGRLCTALADTMRAQRDEAGAPVFPPGGIRVLAYPAAHHAVADGGTAGRAAGGDGDYGFVYLNLRIGSGRSAAVKTQLGDALLACTKTHVAPLLQARQCGVTLQVDESPGQVYDGKLGNLHSLFQPPAT